MGLPIKHLLVARWRCPHYRGKCLPPWNARLGRTPDMEAPILPQFTIPFVEATSIVWTKDREPRRQAITHVTSQVLNNARFQYQARTTGNMANPICQAK